MKIALAFFVTVLLLGGNASSLVAEEESPALEKPKKITRDQVLAELEKLRNPKDELRASAYEKLKSFGPSYAPIIVKYLKDTDETVRLWVARLLGDLKNPAVVPDLLKLARKEEVLLVRRKLVQALGKMASPELLEPLSSLLKSEKHPAVVRDCLMALGETAHPGAIDVILEFVEDKGDPYFEEIGGFALRKLSGRTMELKLHVWKEWWAKDREKTMNRFERAQKEKELKALARQEAESSES